MLEINGSVGNKEISYECASYEAMIEFVQQSLDYYEAIDLEIYDNEEKAIIGIVKLYKMNKSL